MPLQSISSIFQLSSFPSISVFAHKSKKMRAVPISVLYSQKKVFHVRQFQKLEMQMSSFVASKKSPDRVDALVWGVSTLMKSQIQNNQAMVFFA